MFSGVLDFDFEKLCSVSLSHVNVYACMVCGKYFQVLLFLVESRTRAINPKNVEILRLHSVRLLLWGDM